MKSWILLPFSGIALAIGLMAGPAPTAISGPSQRILVHAPVSVSVVVASAEQSDIMTDACVFSAEAMAAGVPAQCGHASIVRAVVVETRQPRHGALKWPGDFVDLTATAAADAWDATLCFVDGLFGYARETSGLDI